MWLCSGQDAVFENQAYDPDGDSLAFSLVDCQGASGSVNYNMGYSSTAPLGPGWTVGLDSQTGTLTFTANPGPAQAGYVCLEIAEYRNGVLINSTIMDYKVDVAACQTSNNAAPTLDSLFIVQNGLQTGLFEAEVWLGDTLSFGLLAQDSPGDTITTRLDTASRVATASLSTTGINPQLVTVTWPAQQLGRHVIRLFAHDQHCPTPGSVWRTVVIHVVSPPSPLVAFYPGDANLDGTVNQYDILALGLSYNATGGRSLAPPFDTSWQAYSRQPWRGNFAFGGNYAYADCDASGRVDALDRDIVDKHFGASHMMGAFRPVFVPAPLVPLNVVVDADTFAGGDSIEARIELGTAAQPANGVYGVSFVLTYDTALVDSFRISTSFANSWLGTQSDLLTFDKQLISQGKLAIAVTRTDQMAVSGHGELAGIIIIEDDVAGKREEYLNVNLSIGDVAVLTAGGHHFDRIAVQNEEFVVTRAVTGISSFEAKPLRIFPQPAGEGPAFAQLSNHDGAIAQIDIMDMKGVSILKHSSTIQQNRVALEGVEQLSRGMYLVKIQVGESLWLGKLLK
jgi:hypothetical protein